MDVVIVVYGSEHWMQSEASVAVVWFCFGVWGSGWILVRV